MRRVLIGAPSLSSPRTGAHEAQGELKTPFTWPPKNKQPAPYCERAWWCALA